MTNHFRKLYADTIFTQALRQRFFVTTEIAQQGKKSYEDYGFFTQTYMPMFTRIQHCDFNDKVLIKLLTTLKFVNIQLTRNEEFLFHQQKIESCLLSCIPRKPNEFYAYCDPCRDNLSEVYEELKCLDC